jgi:uncharacterized membrane protein
MMDERRYFDTQRLLSVTDGVVAISMTLLVLTLSVPVVKDIPNSEGLWPEMRGLWRETLAYLMSFFIVGLLWSYNHLVFRHIRRANGTLLLINMVFLLAVSIMPFSAALVANNWDERLAAIVYGSVMFLAAAATAGSFAYATYRRRLVDEDLEASFIRRENTIAVWLLAVLAMGAGLGFISPFFTYAMLGTLVVFYWVTIALDREGVSARRK